MIAYISALVLLAFALVVIGLRKTYYFYPARELKRQARRGDHDAARLYRAVAYSGSLRLLLWFLIGTSVAASYILLTAVAPAWIVFIAVAGLIWYAFAWSPNARVSRLETRIALVLTPPLVWLLYYTQPVFDKLARTLESHRPVIFHTGLFERADLIELIQNQRDITDSRIPHAELDLVLHALSFGDKTVGEVLIPRRQVTTLKADDAIGPILLAELYDSKHSRFPVISASGEVCGVLYLRDVLAARSGGSVRTAMQSAVHYVHEEQTLYQVLHAFLATKHGIFIVVNSDENYVGIITIEDVLEQVIGRKIEDDFDSYDDRRAVAASAPRPLQVPAGRPVVPTTPDSTGETL